MGRGKIREDRSAHLGDRLESTGPDSKTRRNFFFGDPNLQAGMNRSGTTLVLFVNSSLISHSEMNEPFDRIRDHFLKIIDLESPEERERYLEECCRKEPDIAERLRSMVQAHVSSVEPETDGECGRESFDLAVDPAVFGEKFDVVELLGEGGFGSVYLARQTRPLRRLVALKVIKPGTGSEEVIGRFRIEQGALAIMNHPGIAKVLETGQTGDGRPFFVMEYVEGQPITKYCDEHRLSLRERLVLFCDCCHAIIHAHQKGVIHRDLKPSNILVADYDGVSLPKVIDFGIAKALTPELQEDAFQTGKFHLIGSPLYMSPEQAGWRKFPIDTRTDVYSLGALLYQLVCGVPPLDPDRLASEDLLSALEIIKSEKPPELSRRFQQLDAERQRECLRKQRANRAEHLRNLRGELSQIISAATEKDPADRYQSVADLEEDIQNYLHDRPLSIRPPGSLYVAGKFIQRNRVAVGLAATVALILIGSLAFALWQLNRALTAEELARIRLGAANRANRDANSKANELRKARDVLEELVYAGDLGLAAKELEEGDISTATAYVTRYFADSSGAQSDHRGYEWYFLHQLMNRDHEVLQQMPKGYSFARFLPDSPWLVTGHHSGVLTLLDARDQRVIWQRVGHLKMINHADLSPDGKWLASCGDDGRVCIWNLESQSLEKSFQADSGVAYRVFFLADSQRVIISGEKSKVGIWDWKTGEKRSSLEGIQWNPKGAFDVSADRSIAVLQSKEDTFDFFSLEDGGKHFRQLRFGRGNAARCLKISSDQRWLVAGLRLNQIAVWDLETGKRVEEHFGHRDDIQSLAFHPEQAFFASSDRSGVIRFWTLRKKSRSLQEVTTFWPTAMMAHTDRVWSMDFSPTGNQLVSAGRDGTVKLWRGRQTTRLLTFEMDPNDCNACWLDEQTLLYSEKNFLFVWHLQEDRREKLGTFDTPIGCMKFDPANQIYALGLSSGEIRIFDRCSHEEIQVLPGHAPHYVSDLIFSPDGSLFSSGNDDRTVRWNLATGQPEQQIARDRKFNDLLLDPVENTIYVGYEDNVMKWELDKGNRAVPFLVGHNNSLECLTFACNGRLIVTGSDDRKIKVWDKATGRLLHTIEGHDFKLHEIKCATDEKTVVAGDDNGILSFSHPQYGRLIMKYDLKNFWGKGGKSLSGEIRDICICPDGRKIAVALVDFGIVVLEIPPDRAWPTQQDVGVNEQDAPAGEE